MIAYLERPHSWGKVHFVLRTNQDGVCQFRLCQQILPIHETVFVGYSVQALKLCSSAEVWLGYSEKLDLVGMPQRVISVINSSLASPNDCYGDFFQRLPFVLCILPALLMTAFVHEI